MLVTFYKIGAVHFLLLGTSGFHAKAKNEGLLVRDRVVVRTSYMKISRRYLTDYVKTLHQKACRTSSKILFLLIQPIKSFICGVVVAVAVVIS